MASSRLAMVPMFVRSRPSRTRWTISLSWPRLDSTTKSIARPWTGHSADGPTMDDQSRSRAMSTRSRRIPTHAPERRRRLYRPGARDAPSASSHPYLRPDLLRRLLSQEASSVVLHMHRPRADLVRLAVLAGRSASRSAEDEGTATQRRYRLAPSVALRNGSTVSARMGDAPSS